MPFRDDYPVSSYDVESAANNVRAELEPLLCEACALLENEGMLKKLSKDLRTWYENHSKKEQHRVALEAAQKLTVKERKALGINLDVLKRKARSLV